MAGASSIDSEALGAHGDSELRALERSVLEARRTASRRAEMAQVSEDEPLRLRRPGDAEKEWWEPYYAPSAREHHERLVFGR